MSSASHKDTAHEKDEGTCRAELALSMFNQLFVPHPWHGVSPGADCPTKVMAYIESTPGDCVKYEVHKPTGFLMVDRPQKFSSVCPALYGYIPRTYCDDRLAALCVEGLGKCDPKSPSMQFCPEFRAITGDHDPLDICILSSRPITNNGILVTCRPLGGFRMIDHGEADDKIIAVLDGDPSWKDWQDISDIPAAQLAMLKHYFLTYKMNPDLAEPIPVAIPQTYGREEAYRVIQASIEDYNAKYGDIGHQFFSTMLAIIRSNMAEGLALAQKVRPSEIEKAKSSGSAEDLAKVLSASVADKDPNTIATAAAAAAITIGAMGKKD
eukprot:TRINITY_DN443_c0_g2_i1.p1 TRINITY_DN443_c0_g2~~TRINITY_DN443_c0_g2_i1.p1  ORF type:complete len:324 (+),score=65.77 TRINITY_DN443_c0_g2_i1:201-1172(+)